MQDIVACLDEFGDLVVPRTPAGDELLLSRGLALYRPWNDLPRHRAIASDVGGKCASSKCHLRSK